MKGRGPLLLIAGIILLVLGGGGAKAVAGKHSQGGTAGYVNPVGKGLRPYRIDQGVDYWPPGNLYALSSGTITNVYSSGWPGGTFIVLHLDSGKYAGRYVYYAESIRPDVSDGDHVHAGQQVGTATSCPGCGIELGWADPASATKCGSSCRSLAMAAGETAKGLAAGDAGAYPTRDGVDFSNLIKSLGGPPGSTEGKPVQG